MRKRLIWTLTLGAVAAIAFAGISTAKPVVVSLGNLVLMPSAARSRRNSPTRIRTHHLQIGREHLAGDSKHRPRQDLLR
jgi:hypothetical protein